MPMIGKEIVSSNDANKATKVSSIEFASKLSFNFVLTRVELFGLTSC